MKSSTRTASIVVLIVVTTMLAYYPLGSNRFINYDDPGYVTRNEHIQQGLTPQTIGWAFTATEQSNWHPITWISLAFDRSLFGSGAGAYHIISLAIHIASSLLLFLFLFHMTTSVWPSAFVAFVFALHPLHVESVAWAAERKDILCGFFWILSLGAFRRRRATGSVVMYALSITSFALALMSKPMAVTLPILLLLLDYRPLSYNGPERDAPGWRPKLLASVKDLIPFFALSAASAVVTYIVQQQGGAMQNLNDLSIWERLSNAAVAYQRYVRMFFFPSGLSIFYPHPGGNLPLIEIALSIAFLALVSYATWRLRARHPYLAVGWLWFIVTLLPVIGLVQVGLQAMADRYMYMPIIGLAIIAAWGARSLVPGGTLGRTLIAAAYTIAVCLMIVQTARESAKWKDSRTIFQSALERTTDNYVAHNNYGVDLADSGDHAAAIPHFEEALRILPGYMPARINYSRSLLAIGDLRRATENYRWMIDHGWNDPALYALTGRYLEEAGNETDALTYYSEAIERDPGDVDSRCRAARLYAGRGGFTEARKLCAEVLKISPKNSRAHDVLGIIDGMGGDLDAARREFELAMTLDSTNADAYNDLGILTRKEGDEEQAAGLFEKAVALDSSHWNAHFNLGTALAGKKDFAGAERHWRAAASLNPYVVDARINLGKLYTMQARYDSARAQLAAAMRIDSSNALLRFTCGNLLEAEKDFTGAAVEYAKALQYAPSSTQAKSALERVRRIAR